MEKRYKIGNVILKDSSSTKYENVGIVHTPSALLDFIEDYEFGQHKSSKCYTGKVLSDAMCKVDIAVALNQWRDEAVGPLDNISKGLSFIPGITTRFFKAILDEKIIPPKADVPNELPIGIINAIKKYTYTYLEDNDEGVSAFLDFESPRQHIE